MKPETLLKNGWRPIVSEAQAAQFLRRELKQFANRQQRNPDRPLSLRYLLAIKTGNWYKFYRSRENGICQILLWRMVPD